MKKHFFYVFIVSLLFVAGCDLTPDNGDLNVILTVTAGNTPIVLNTGVYKLGSQKVRFKFEKIRFYLSNIRLRTVEGGEVVFNTEDNVSLVRWGEEEITAFKISAPPGEFDQITIGCGLTPDINALSPDDFPSSHPLANDQNMYWEMATKYIFLKIEGFADTTGTNTGSFDCPFVYHVGLDENYYDGVITKNFSIAEKGETDINLKLDIWKLWKGEYTIDLRTNSKTMTLDNPELAHKIMDNFAEGWVAE